MDYTDPDWCAALFRSEMGLSASPHGLEADLAATARKDANGILYYRPLLLCARYVGTSGKFSEAKGAKYRTEERVAAYLQRQADLDADLGLIIPPGSEAIKPATRWPYSGSVPLVVGS